MSEKFHDRFDYENAKRDIWDVGGDPDGLSYRDPEKRDKYMRQLGMDPRKYGSRWDEYKAEQEKSVGSSGSAEEGCYIATCVYGSYDCPEVRTLRRFRDRFLRRSAPGRAAVRAYYAVSPFLVRTIGKRQAVRSFWKRQLDPLVRLLERKGYRG